MKEKQRPVENTPSGGGGSIFDTAPGLPENKNVSVSSGPYAEELPVAGMSVGEVRRRFSDRFDIDSQSQAIVNGNVAKETDTLKVGESLMFVRHAGEKGAKLEIEGEEVAVLNHGNSGSMHMKIETLCQRVGPGMSTGPVVLPAGIKTVLSQGNITLWVWEQPPKVQRLSWIAADSLAPYGGSATYRNVRIALPYLIIVAVFARDDNGLPELLCKDECFFRTEPLKSLDDELSFPGLLNCSKFGNISPNAPLSWICTQHLKRSKKMQSQNPGDRFQYGFEAVRYCLLETSFNLSSEHNEGNSWYGASKNIDKRIATIEAWEAATEKNPLFVLEVPWIKTGHSVAKLAERIFKQQGASAGSVKTADDLARIIING